MLVDDEKIVRLGLQAMADWESHGFSMCFEASNGMQALEILTRNPDIQIIIVDLQMPKMGGIEFLEELKTWNLNVKVIILSAHDNYDLVRQGFRLGISDYIVKSEMNKGEILKHLQNAAAQINQPKSTDLDDIEKSHLREKYLSDIFTDTDSKKYLEFIQPNRPFTCFAVACVLSERHSEMKSKMPLLRSTIMDIMPKGLFVDIALVTQEEMGMLFALKNKNTANNEIGVVLQKFRNRVENYINLNITIGVSNIVSNDNDIRAQYKIARLNADMRFVLGQGRTIFPEDVKNIVSHDIGSIAGHSRKLVGALKEGNATALANELQQMFATIGRYNPKSIESIYPYYMEVIFAIMRYLDEIGVETTDVFRRSVNFYDEIYKFATREELNNWLKRIVLWTAECLKEKESDKLNRSVIMAREFIKKNYREKALSLRMVSEYAGLSETHLSSIFAKQTGKTIIEYVTELRIEKAKNLLQETNLKVYEIAERVGFANAEYFSKTFKKVTGKSPNAFFK